MRGLPARLCSGESGNGSLARSRGGIDRATAFFSTRVMALVREQQNGPSLLDLIKLWKTARGLVLSAASLVVLLGGLTFLTPQPNSDEGITALARTNYSTEGLVFGDDATSTDASPSNEQVMDVVFTAEDTDAGNQK